MSLENVARLIQGVYDLELRELESELAESRTRRISLFDAERLAVNPSAWTSEYREAVSESRFNRLVLESAKQSVQHPTWPMISRWLRNLGSPKETRLVERHVKEYECQRCRELATASVMTEVCARMQAVRIRNRSMARASSEAPVELRTRAGDVWDVAISEDEGVLHLDVRTTENEQAGQLVAYCLSSSNESDAERGFLLPRADDHGVVSAQTTLNMDQLYEKFADECDVEVFPVAPEGLSKADKPLIREAIKADRHNGRDLTPWIEWFGAAEDRDEPLNEEATELVTKLRKELQMEQSTRNKGADAVEPPEEEQATEFKVGDVVAVKSNPEETGAVVSVSPSDSENRYSVFRDGGVHSYYASQLQAVAPEGADESALHLDDFHARLSSLLIEHPSTSNLYSLTSGKIDFVAYQYRPVLKLIRSDRPRILIADGVGVGKTIEAGLILKEMQARNDIRSVLVICPKPLVVERKWERELRRFDERFTHLDGQNLRYCIEEMDNEGEWPAEHSKAIMPLSLFNRGTLLGARGKRGLVQLDPPPKFDLVIVDEAHRICSQNTLVHQGVQYLCDHAEAVVFLTATPVQLRSDDLFVLLNTLRPDLVIDQQSFQHMAAPNRHFNEAIGHLRRKETDYQSAALAAIDEAGNTPWGQSILQGSPEFQETRRVLSGSPIDDNDRVATITSLERQHTFARIINRTRRRDIGELFTKRKPETVEVEFTPEQQELHDAVVSTQARIFSEVKGHANVNFMLTTIRRQTASCIYGLAPLLREILTRHLDDLSWLESDRNFEGFDDSDFQTVEADVRRVLDLLDNLSFDDPKIDALVQIVNEKQEQTKNKVMVFSAFRHTLAYLEKRLNDEGIRVSVVHGGTKDSDRVKLRDRFRMDREDPKAIDVLLFSEVGCEGLDYEFCDCMVNYDLPWNPMRIEQRIGRIDRRGQQSPSVAIYNLITPGTIDADIYNRCLMRIGVFENEVGGSEEILGEITAEIRDIAENLQLNAEEQAEKLQQLADNKIRLIQEQQELESSDMELFGLNVPKDDAEEEVRNASSYWLSQPSLQNLVSKYLAEVSSTDKDYVLGDGDLKTLRLSQQLREALLADFRKLPKNRAPAFRQWEKWLKGGEPHLMVTFNPTCAQAEQEATLLNPVHPLIRQASHILSAGKALVTTCELADSTLPAGEFPFAIYQWQLRGVQDDLVLKTVSTNKEVEEHLLGILENGTSGSKGISPPDADVLDQLERDHYSIWLEARDEHQDTVSTLVKYRQESLNTSHQARLSLLNEQLTAATNENIRRMKQSQVDSANADYQRRSEELNTASSLADITTQLVAYGTVRITVCS